MSYNNYSTIGEFGPSINQSTSNVFAYCAVTDLESGFAHGSIGGSGGLLSPEGQQCQIGSAQVCAKDYGGVCRVLAEDRTTGLPNAMSTANMKYYKNPTKGEIFLRNVASERFLTKMSENCKRVYQPLDPTVAGSPLISSWLSSGTKCQSSNWKNGVCVPEYGVDPKTIDQDEVMNKILEKPWIAMDVLVNMYNSAVRNGTLENLKGTKLYRLFKSPQFLKITSR
jgi:hypothetical protein